MLDQVGRDRETDLPGGAPKATRSLAQKIASSSGSGSAIIVAAPLILASYALTVVVMAGRGGVASLTGVLLLGWSGGGFIGVGDPYLFMTLAAVVVYLLTQLVHTLAEFLEVGIVGF